MSKQRKSKKGTVLTPVQRKGTPHYNRGIYWVVVVRATPEVALGPHIGKQLTREVRTECAVGMVTMGHVTAIWPVTRSHKDIKDLAMYIEDICSTLPGI